ncbi:MAG: hypothetical protein LWY06_09975 [Firmicutes bacterium]|nr:hypothetical protein [Bacillota bacterium]
MDNGWSGNSGMHNSDPNNQGQSGGDPHGGSHHPYGGNESHGHNQGYGETDNYGHSQHPGGYGANHNQGGAYGSHQPYGQEEPAFGVNSPYSQGYGGADPNTLSYGNQPAADSFSEPQKYGEDLTPYQPQSATTGKKGCGFAGCMIFSFLSLVFIIFIIMLIVESESPRAIYLNSLTVESAKIAEKNDEEGRYIRVEVPRLDAPQEVMWVPVDPAFYDKHRVGEDIGVLLGNYDVYKTGHEYWLFGKKTRKFEKTSWGIENVYDNYDMAKKANPQETFEADGVVKDKTLDKSGLKYLLLESNGKTVKAVVTDDVFNNTNAGQKLKCEFESTGDYVRFKGLK